MYIIEHSKLEMCWFTHWRFVTARSQVVDSLSRLSVFLLVFAVSDSLKSCASSGQVFSLAPRINGQKDYEYDSFMT